MSDQDNRRFFEHFSVVLGVLVVFTIIIYFVANHISGATQVQQRGTRQRRRRGGAPQARRQRGRHGRQHGGRRRDGGPRRCAVGRAGHRSRGNHRCKRCSAAAASGEDIYNGTCFACHATGAAGAPKLGDKVDWGPRIAKGTDTLGSTRSAASVARKASCRRRRADYSDDLDQGRRRVHGEQGAK